MGIKLQSTAAGQAAEVQAVPDDDAGGTII
jgi:hypothetical protein